MITQEEVSARIAGELQSIEARVYQLKSAALQALITEVLLQQEAAKRGLSVEELVAQLAPPPRIEAAELQAAYETSRRQTGHLSEFEAKEQITEHLLRRKRTEAYRNLGERLRSGAQVEVVLPTPKLNIPLDTETDATLGPPTARVTIVEFADFECAFCRQSQEALTRVLRQYRNNVRLVFKHFPLPTHKTARRAALASLCAQEGGRFWEYHDGLFLIQPPFTTEKLAGIAEELGLDRQEFLTCLESNKHAQTVDQHIRLAERALIVSTPTFVVNGQVFRGALTYERWKSILDPELHAPRDTSTPEPPP